jgi:dCTP deaminase
MAFLGSNELRAILPTCIDQFDDKRIDNVAYELSLGDEVYLTDSISGKKEFLDAKNPQVIIKPGQFALLLTMETVNIPSDILAFISIKFSQKIKGLVNISGFHVDPGFKGKIIFSVYNAGPATIVLDRGKAYFMIWFSELTSVSQPYDGKHKDQKEITADHISALKGELASPNTLLQKITDLDTKLTQKTKELDAKRDYNKWIFQAIAVILAGLWIGEMLKNNNLSRGFEYGVTKKTITEEVRAINIDSIISVRVDSIVRNKKLQNDSTKK